MQVVGIEGKGGCVIRIVMNDIMNVHIVDIRLDVSPLLNIKLRFCSDLVLLLWDYVDRSHTYFLNYYNRMFIILIIIFLRFA